MNLLSKLSILFLFLFLEPVEESLLSRLKLQKVDTILGLLDLLKFAVTWEHIETLKQLYSQITYVDGILGISIAPLELLHALCILSDSDESLSAHGLNLASIKLHLASLDLNDNFRLNN